MFERLIEDWLDSASERAYQAAFRQMLVARGHSVLHSTRHAALELGKDVISIGPDGQPCAFQLKGNPGENFGVRAFRNINDQLLQLATLAIKHPDAPKTPHVGYLVTNGRVQEEAWTQQRAFNANLEQSGIKNRLEIIDREKLIDWALRLGPSMWPSDFERIRDLLRFLTEDGSERWDLSTHQRSLILTLRISGVRVGAAELKRRVAAAALWTAIANQRHAEAKNHAAVIAAWTGFCLTAIAATERHRRSFDKNAASSVSVALQEIFARLVHLAGDVLGAEYLLEGDVRFDSLFYRARQTELAGLLSLLWFWCEEKGWPDDLDQGQVEEWLDDAQEGLYLWGEAATPACILYYLYRRRTTGDVAPERLLISMVHASVERSPGQPSVGLPSPYWNFQSVLKQQLSDIGFPVRSRVGRYAHGVESFAALGLFYLLVRGGWKEACRTLWPDLTRINHVAFVPDDPWDYCLSTSKDGYHRSVQLQTRKEWPKLQRDSKRTAADYIPRVIDDSPILLALLLLHLPHRLSPEAIGRLEDHWGTH